MSALKLSGYRSLMSQRDCTVALFHNSTPKQAFETSRCIFCCIPLPPPLPVVALLFSLPLGSTLPYLLPAEKKKSQEHLEGKVLSPRMVNMGIAARAVKTNVIHHID